jgi:hypothetical protein
MSAAPNQGKLLGKSCVLPSRKRTKMVGMFLALEKPATTASHCDSIAVWEHICGYSQSFTFRSAAAKTSACPMPPQKKNQNQKRRM